MNSDACSYRGAGVLIWLLSIGACFADGSEPEKLEIQPSGKRSSIASDGVILDKNLAKWSHDLFVQEGQIRLLHATYVFQQCFGGGFLDDLKFTFGRGIRWVGGSASLHSQRAIGTISQTESDARPADKRPPAVFIEATPRSLWTSAFLPELAANQTILSALQNAETEDIVGPNATKPLITLENSQWSSGNGGEEILLADPEATSRHAIIWGGRKGNRRHYENMKSMRELLISKWGSPGPTVTIAMFYGDGAHGPGGLTFPAEWGMRGATDEGLRQYMASLRSKMDETAQFFFYATGHGKSASALPAPTKVIAQGITESEEFELSSTELQMLGEESEHEPALIITYEDFLATSGEVSVSLNGVVLGTIPPATEPGEQSRELAVPKSLLGAENTVALYNTSDADFTQTEIAYHLGEISDDPPRLVYDYDGDGDVDRLDLSTFQSCLTGPGLSYEQDLPQGCTLVLNTDQFISADYDRDHDVDQSDFALFQRCFSGENVFANPECLY